MDPIIPDPLPSLSEKIFNYPITDTLDLHQFHPRDVPSVVDEYIIQCREKMILSVRIIHGKGTGRQKAVVIERLKDNPGVKAFMDAGDYSGWGATLVELSPADPTDPTDPVDSEPNCHDSLRS